MQVSQRPLILRHAVRYGEELLPRALFPSARLQATRTATTATDASATSQASAPADQTPEKQEVSTVPAWRQQSRDVRLPVTFRRMNDYMNAMQRDMDTLMNAVMPGFNDLFSDPFRRSFDVFTPFAASPVLETVPSAAKRALAMEVQETDKEFVLTAMVPGFSKDEIKISLDNNNVLTIKGEHTEGEKGERFQSFVRRLSLPDHADVEKISAKTEHGVLTVQIPKVVPKETPPKEIPIN